MTEREETTNFLFTVLKKRKSSRHLGVDRPITLMRNLKFRVFNCSPWAEDSVSWRTTVKRATEILHGIKKESFAFERPLFKKENSNSAGYLVTYFFKYPTRHSVRVLVTKFVITQKPNCTIGVCGKICRLPLGAEPQHRRCSPDRINRIYDQDDKIPFTSIFISFFLCISFAPISLSS